MRASSWLRSLFKLKKPILSNSIVKELTPKQRAKRAKCNKAQRAARKNNWRRS